MESDPSYVSRAYYMPLSEDLFGTGTDHPPDRRRDAVPSPTVRTSQGRGDDFRPAALLELVDTCCCPTGDLVADGVGDAPFVDREMRLARGVRESIGQALG